MKRKALTLDQRFRRIERNARLGQIACIILIGLAVVIGGLAIYLVVVTHIILSGV